METLPFRPKFSNDQAWLPPWLQSDSSPPLLRDHDHPLPLSPQNMDSFKGKNNHVNKPNLLLSRESGHNIYHLYLSGEESSPVMITPSCEKVMHLNLHLSTDGTSSIISTQFCDTSQEDKHNSGQGKGLQPVEALHGPRETRLSNMVNDASDIDCFHTPLNENCSGNVCNQISYGPNKSRQDSLEKYKLKGTECDDIVDAVELSIGASEALVIHEIVQTESTSEAASAAAILEVALRVKRARLDGTQDSFCFLKDMDNSSDILSDLGDSDMEDAYRDVGLLFTCLDNAPCMDLSISRVQNTPMTHTYPEEEREIQSEWNEYQRNCFSTIAATPVENNSETNKSKDVCHPIFNVENQENLQRNTAFDFTYGSACHLGSDDLEDIQMNLGENNDSVHLDLHQEANPLHVGNTNINIETEISSSRYQSRWLGGWTVQKENACFGKESKCAKSIPKPFINEESYLSESADVAPDQNSVVNNRPCCSKSSVAGNSLEESCKSKTETKEASISQDVVKDSTTSVADPLCSIVPCSISSETGESSMANEGNDNPELIEAVKISRNGPEVVETTILTSSVHSGENIGRKNNTELAASDTGHNSINCQQTEFLKTYTTEDLPGYSLPPLMKIFNFELARGKDDGRLLHDKQKLSSPNHKVAAKPPQVEPVSGCAAAKSHQQDGEMRLLSVEENISIKPIDGKLPEQQPNIRSILSSAIPSNNEETCVENTFGRPTQRRSKNNLEYGAEVCAHLKVRQTSPLVLGSRTRRFKAPNVSPAGKVYDQAHRSDIICHESRENSEAQRKNLPEANDSARKRVHFSNVDIELRPNKSLKRMPNFTLRPSSRIRKRPGLIDREQCVTSQEVKECLTNCRIKERKKMIFQGLDFLLTGFSKKKEMEIEGLLRKHGGMVLSDMPSPLRRPRNSSLRSDAERLPVVLCSKKLQTTRFLYGCAVNAFLLKVGWVYDSIRAGSVLIPDKYSLLSRRTNGMLNQIEKSISQANDKYIFDKVGIMLHGTHRFCTKLTTIIKLGRGLVYKSLQCLVQSLELKKISLGVIVSEVKNRATRHLKKCASEQNIPVVPASWIMNSLFEGKLLPLDGNYNLSQSPATKVSELSVLPDWSQEI